MEAMLEKSSTLRTLFKSAILIDFCADFGPWVIVSIRFLGGIYVIYLNAPSASHAEVCGFIDCFLFCFTNPVRV